MPRYTELFSYIHSEQIKRVLSHIDQSELSNSYQKILKLFLDIKAGSEPSIDTIRNCETDGREHSNALQIIEYLVQHYKPMDNQKINDIQQDLSITHTSNTINQFLFSELLVSIAQELVQEISLEKAKSYFNEAIVWKKRIGDRHGIAITYKHLGIVEIRLGNLPEALDSFKRSIPEFELFDDKINLGYIHNNIGGVMLSRGNLKVAKTHYSRAFDLANSSSNIDLKSKVLNNLGIIHFERTEYESAINCYEQSLHLKEQTNETAGMAPTLHNIGKIYGKQGDYYLAVQFLQKSKDRCPDTNPILLANTLNELINYLSKMQDIDEARTYLTKLEELYNSHDLPIIRQFYLLSEAIILKKSDLIGYDLDTIRKLETIINDKTLHAEITQTALLHFIDLKLDTIQSPVERNLLELKSVMLEMYKVAQKKGSLYDLIEVMLLLSRYCRLIGSSSKSEFLLIQAEVLAQEQDFEPLLKKCSQLSQQLSSTVSVNKELIDLKEQVNMVKITN